MTTQQMGAEEIAIRQRLRDDYAHYATKCLKIRTKGGAVLPLELNRAQLFLHGRIEEQRAKLGKVRAIILKGRQQGCSTYVEGRLYWKVSHRRGIRAFILTHEQDATNNLFGMAERFHENCPEIVRPHTGAANAKELHFDLLDSGYGVGTAGTKAVGRSQTLQFFHGSEVAFWPFADDHASGVLQAVPDMPDTEIILESTANGIGNFYHRMWQDAEVGLSDYEAIFIPWWWTDEYRKSVGPDFKLDADEADYAAFYGLSNEQMAWRRAKIVELKDEAIFKREYPATPTEAFEQSGDATFIPPSIVARARKCKVDNQTGPLIIGVDPARFGDDRTSIIRRQGRIAFKLESHSKKDTMQVVGIVGQIIATEKPAKVFIDVGGLGAGVVDRLKELGHDSVIMAVNGGERAIDEARYLNKRAEMWGGMKEWLTEQPAQIPDSDTLHADLTGPHYTYDSSTRLKLESKPEMKKRGVRSPDEGDALALTFAYPVAADSRQSFDRLMEQIHSRGEWVG
jgi:hypothetical protein